MYQTAESCWFFYVNILKVCGNFEISLTNIKEKLRQFSHHGDWFGSTTCR